MAFFARKRRRRIFILPSLFGAIYGLSLFLMLLMAYTYQNNLAYALTFFLVAFGVAGMLATHRLLEGLRFETRRPVLVFEEDEFDPPLLLEATDAPASAFETRPLGLDALTVAGSRWLALRRGAHSLSRLEVRTSFPAGLFRAWTRLDVKMSFLIAPKPQDFGLRPGDGGDDRRDVVRGKARPGEPDELRGLRPAREEEPLSRIDWAALARGLGRLGKEFDEDPSPEIILRWRDTESLGDPERRLRQLSAWIVAARGRLQVEGPSGRWFRRAEDALEDLARFGEAP